MGWREAVEVVKEGAGVNVCMCVQKRRSVYVGGSWLEADSDSLCFLSDRPWINLRHRPHLSMNLQHTCTCTHKHTPAHAHMLHTPPLHTLLHFFMTRSGEAYKQALTVRTTGFLSYNCKGSLHTKNVLDVFCESLQEFTKSLEVIRIDLDMKGWR